MITSRRSFFLGAGATFLAAPSIVRVAANLMPVSAAHVTPPLMGLRPSKLIIEPSMEERAIKLLRFFAADAPVTYTNPTYWSRNLV